MNPCESERTIKGSESDILQSPRRRWLTAALCAGLLTSAACGSAEPAPTHNAGSRSKTTESAKTEDDDEASDEEESSKGDEEADEETKPSGRVDAGAKLGTSSKLDAAASGPVTSSSDGGKLTEESDASTGPKGPLTLPEPDKIGPYEVIVDQNVGEGFSVPVASSDTGDGVAGCSSFVSLFGQDEAESKKFITIPTGMKMGHYSLYRPKEWEEGKKYPVLTWGNGTCSMPEGYGKLIRHVASHGFVVIAANSRQVGQNSPMTKALDWVVAANKDEKSPYFGKFDTDKIGAFGHSQGGAATAAAARDARVKTAVLLNGGTSSPKPSFFVSGDRDLGGGVSSYRNAMMNATASKSAFIFYHMIPGSGSFDGHLTLITQPDRVSGPTAAWFRAVLQDDPVAITWFAGTDCKLCNKKTDFDFGAKGF